MSTSETRARQFFREIIADEKGLRWKEKFRGEWQTASWEEVSDFYLEPPQRLQLYSVPSYSIRFHDGRTLTFSAGWKNYRELAGTVAYHAKSESARRPDGTIGWELLGTRPADLPVSFAYSEEYALEVQKAIDRRVLTRVAIFGGVGIIAVLIHSSSMVSSMIGPLLIPLINELAHRPSKKQVSEVKRRSQLGERFDVTNETLTFWQNGEPYSMLWSDIVGYDEPVFSVRPQEDTIRIRTITGKEFSFTSRMQGAATFAKIIALHAREAVAYRRGKNDQEALGGVDIRWTGGDEGKGDRIFHQRTRSNRKQLLLLWSIPLIQLIPFFLLLKYGPLAIVLLLLVVIFMITALPKTYRYFRDKVVIAKDHIQVVQHGKETILNWMDVVDLETTPTHLVVSGKDRKTGEFKSLQLVTNDYAYGNELPDLIRERMEWGRAAAERAAISAADVAHPTWSEGIAREESPQLVMQRER